MVAIAYLREQKGRSYRCAAREVWPVAFARARRHSIRPALYRGPCDAIRRRKVEQRRSSPERERPCRNAQLSITQNLRAQTTVAAQKFLRAGSECLVHPIARTRFLHSAKAYALQLEVGTNECIEISAACDRVAAKDRCRFVVNAESIADRAIDFVGEEGDLSLVLIAV